MSKRIIESPHPPPALVLGSSSPYRRALLDRLGVCYEIIAPDCDETRLPGEAPAAMVRRLAEAKCALVTDERPAAAVIASDQIACRGDEILGKPGSAEIACAQLRASAGREVAFLTAVAIKLPAQSAPRRHLDVTRVQFRALGAVEIERYVKSEQPLDCAGSFKCEGLGISLFERIISTDPTALMGLPLIWTSSQLRAAGFAIP